MKNKIDKNIAGQKRQQASLRGVAGFGVFVVCCLIFLTIHSGTPNAQRTADAELRECTRTEADRREAEIQDQIDASRTDNRRGGRGGPIDVLNNDLFRSDFPSRSTIIREERQKCLNQFRQESEQQRQNQLQNLDDMLSSPETGNASGIETNLTNTLIPIVAAVFSPPQIRCCSSCGMLEQCVNDWDCTLCENAGLFGVFGIALLVNQQFISLRDFLVEDWWRGIVQAGLARMTEQLTATAFLQTTAIGSFFDAKHQLERQLVLDKKYTDAIQNYQPSVALCRFGSASASLASSERKSSVNTSLMSRRSLARHLGRKGSVGETISRNTIPRLAHFLNNYCNTSYMGGRLSNEYDAGGTLLQSGLCGDNGGKIDRLTKDIDANKTLLHPKTLNMDLTDTQVTADEQDIFALGANLYGYDVFKRQGARAFRDGEPDFKDNRNLYHRYRALLAKRNVAENSYYKIAGLKSSGSGASGEFLIQIMEQLGMPRAEAENLLSDTPSYNAQLDILTKTIYQNPSFITSLIDKPENVKRQQAAMMAIELMQRREAYKSMRRQEMIIASMLDLFADERFKATNQGLSELFAQGQ